MFIYQLLKLPLFVFCLLVADIRCAPYDRTASKQRLLLVRFGTIYTKEDITWPALPPFSTSFNIHDNYRNAFYQNKQESSSTSSSIPKYTSNSGENKKILIDEKILFQIFNEDGRNKTIKTTTDESRTDYVGFTTETNLETIISGNSTDFDDDYRVGGLAAQHAFITLVGG